MKRIRGQINLTTLLALLFSMGLIFLILVQAGFFGGNITFP